MLKDAASPPEMLHVTGMSAVAWYTCEFALTPSVTRPLMSLVIFGGGGGGGGGSGGGSPTGRKFTETPVSCLLPLAATLPGAGSPIGLAPTPTPASFLPSSIATSLGAGADDRSPSS